MAIPVYALGANPHSCAPLFHSKPDALREGLKRLKIKLIDGYYFRVTMRTYIPGPRPTPREYRPSSGSSAHLPFAEIHGLHFAPPNGVPRRRYLVVPPAECVLLQA